MKYINVDRVPPFLHALRKVQRDVYGINGNLFSTTIDRKCIFTDIFLVDLIAEVH